MIRTKQELLNYLNKKHVNADFSNADEFTTGEISSRLSVSRSLASQYLNELYKEEKLIKVDSRPVYYFSSSELNSDLDIVLEKDTFSSIEELRQIALNLRKNKYSFDSLIGYDGSLGETISEIKAAVLYPSNAGLNYILYGEEGVGKSLLSKCGCEYLIAQKKNVQIEIADCIKAGFITNLKNLIAAADKGVIVIERAEMMSEEDQRAFLEILESKTVKKENHTLASIKCSFVLLYNRPDVKGLGLIGDYFPIKCYVPNFFERYYLEKEKIIINLFRKEEKYLNKHISISYALLRLLMSNHYVHNIDDLANLIRQMTALSNVDNKEELEIGVNNIPENFPHADISIMPDELALIPGNIKVSDYVQIDISDSITELMDSLIAIFKPKPKHLAKSIAEGSNLIEKFYDDYLYKNNYKSKYTAVYNLKYNAVLDSVLSMYNYNLPEYSGTVISYYCYVKHVVSGKIKDWYERNEKDLKIICSEIESEYPETGSIVERIRAMSRYSINVELDNAAVLVLYILFLNNNRLNKQKAYASLIICHGTSTAHSIADTVNSIVGQHIFEYIDMPLDKPMTEIAEVVEKYVIRFHVKTDILLLVDMGSLEELGIKLNGIDNNVYIINNVSTGLALEVGTKLIQDISISSIAEDCRKNFNSDFKIYENKKQKEVILFISDNGKGMANRIKEIFLESLPKHIDVELISCDWIENETTTYAKYRDRIILILGTTEQSIENVKFIPIENLVRNDGINKVTKVLSKYLTQNEMEKFRENLIYNFSLQSIIDNLSVLDAKKVLGYAKKSISILQNELGYKFSSEILPGLYIHICFMVERLLKKESVESSSDHEFEDENKQFVRLARRSFSALCSHYGVELTIGEIKYLHDYIQNDRSNNNE